MPAPCLRRWPGPASRSADAVGIPARFSAPPAAGATMRACPSHAQWLVVSWMHGRVTPHILALRDYPSLGRCRSADRSPVFASVAAAITGLLCEMVIILAEFVLVIPGSVRHVVDAWRAAGSPSQEGIAWPRQRWIDAFPAHVTMFAALPDRLDRSAVRRACVRAAVSPADAEHSFLAVMAWGYGRVGYGPFRVRRLLDAAPNGGAQLQAAASKVAEERPVAAYACLGDHGTVRLPHLVLPSAPSSCTFAPLPPPGQRSSSTASWHDGSAKTPT